MRSIVIILALLFTIPLAGQKWERIHEKFNQHFDDLEYAEALKAAVKQVNFSIETLDSTDLRYMISYYNLAQTYHGLGALEEAKSYLGIAYSLMVPFYANHGAEFADVCELYGRIETELGYHETAANFLAYARDVNAAVHGTESYGYIKSLYYIADLEMARSRYEEMVNVLLEALEIHEQHFPKNHDYARYANFLGLIYMNNGYYPEAAEGFKWALSSYEETGIEKDFPYGHANNNLALVYYYQTDFENAAIHFEKADSIYQILVEGYSENYMMLLNNLASLYYSWEKPGLAREAFEQLEDYLVMYPDHQDLNYINGIENTADYYAEVGELDLAEKYYQKAVLLRSSVIPYDFREHAGCLLLLASLYAEETRPDLAVGPAIEAYSLLVKDCPPGDPDLVWVLSFLGQNFYNLEQFNKSMYYYKLAREQIEHADETLLQEAPSIYNNLGMLYYNQNMLREAIPCMERAHQLDPEDPVTMINLGMIYFDMENHRLAREMFEEAKKIYGKQYGTDHPDYANALSLGIGMKTRYNDYTEKMLEEIREVERICHINQVDSTSSLFIECMGLYRSYYYGIKEYPNSITYGNRALRLAEMEYGRNSKYYADHLLMLANSYLMMGDKENLSRIFEEVQGIAMSLDDLDREELIYTLESRRYADYYYLEEYDLSRESIERVIETDKSRFLGMQNILSVRERATFAAKLTNLVDYNDFLMHFPHDPDIISAALNNRLFTKSILMESERRQRDALAKSGDTVLLDMNERFYAEKKKLSNLRSQFGVKREVLDSIESGITQLEKEISRRLGEKIALGERSISWEHIRDALGEDEAAVEVITFYHRTPPPRVTQHPWYIAFIVTSDMEESPLYLDLFDAVEIIPDYESYRGSVETRSGGPLEAGLYERLWSKIDSAVAGKKTIYFSPDGLFHQINVEALADLENRYVIDKYEIKHINSLADLLKEDRIYGDNRRALLAGDPTFRMTLSSIPDPVPRENSRGVDEFQSRMFPGTRLSQLPGTRTEVDTIGSLLESLGWDCTTLTGDAAAEDAIVSVQSPRVLHLATHGFFSQNANQTSDTVVQTDNRSYNFLDSESDSRSCLFFAGAQNTLYYAYDYQEGSGDGILTAWEIMGMDLDSTELVVLSACETGLGDILNSEGVTGLRRAFHLAGAERIMLSLWEVNDQATQMLMREFYSNWLSGTGIDESLANAKRYMRNETPYSHPRYWAAFILTGI